MPALFLILLSAYYARKYAGIIDAGLVVSLQLPYEVDFLTDGHNFMLTPLSVGENRSLELTVAGEAQPLAHCSLKQSF